MRYSPRQWLGVAILMRESSYNILAALSTGPKSWTQLKDAAKLTGPGLQSALRQLLKQKVIEQILIERKDGIKDKKYVLTQKAKDSKLYEKLQEIKNILNQL